MIKHLQLLFLFVFSTSQLNIFAQNDRSKLSRVEQVSTVENKVPQIFPVENKVSLYSKEKLEILNDKAEFSKNKMQFKLKDSTFTKDKKDVSFIPSDRIFISDNVTYEREILPVNEVAISSEKKLTKLLPSINSKPRILKEDNTIVFDVAKVEISSNKRIYLQQEADDLQREISQNAGNVNYELTKKQKQLEDIKKMLQN